MNARQALLDALAAERYGANQWWTRRGPEKRHDATSDDEISTARRRREMDADFRDMERRKAQ